VTGPPPPVTAEVPHPTAGGPIHLRRGTDALVAGEAEGRGGRGGDLHRCGVGPRYGRGACQGPGPALFVDSAVGAAAQRCWRRAWIVCSGCWASLSAPSNVFDRAESDTRGVA